MADNKNPQPNDPKPASPKPDQKVNEDHDRNQKAVDDAAPQTDGRPGP